MDVAQNSLMCFLMCCTDGFFFCFLFSLSACIYVCWLLYQAVYSASFPEDIPTNKGILTVGATDADSGSSAEIQYSLFGIGVEDFYMDANTGAFNYYLFV